MELSPTELLIYISLVAAIIIAGFLMYRKDILFLFRKKKTEGQIINWMASNEKGKKYFYPMIEFQPEGLNRIVFRADERCEGEPLYAPGTKVIIYYLPQDIEFRKVVYP